ncbi:MAG: sigma-70 family RNA polymerase sigma factor [Saprospiraceae bacterium]|nr:sigma-70 family RNA polymerase sigma factor [Saprospiraceae bacterium]
MDSIIKYLCVSARRDLIKRIEKDMKTTSYTNVENDETEFSISIEDILIQEETNSTNKARLHTAFEQLSSRQREAIYLKYYEEMNYEQICEIMNINYQSVRNLISKGILILRENIVSAILLIMYLK